jgi:fucose 4-O-acetylase-like acetyltransferase
MNQRLVQYDLLKGIGILLVVICHAGLGGFPKEFIYTFHMPLFFFASGCFFKDTSFGGYMLKNVKQLLIPYLLFAFCMIVTRCLRTLDIHSALYSISGNLSSLSLTNESDPCLFESIWFLVCLFIVRIIYWFINRLCKGFMFMKVAMCGLLYVIGYTFQRIGINIPFFIDTAFSTILFYALGEYFHKKGYDDKTTPWWWGVIGVLVSLSVCYIFNPHVELKDNKYPFYLVLLSIVIITSLYFICKALVDLNEKRKSYVLGFLEKCGVSSLSILGFHNPIIWFFGHYLQIISAPKIVVLCFLVFITVIAIFYIEKVINKVAPFLLGKS